MTRGQRYYNKHKDDPGFREKASIRSCAWAKANPEKANIRAAKWRTNNPGKRRDTILRNRYCRIRAGQYDEMLATQSGLCGICQKPSVARSLEVDHNHTTEVIRGLLCHRCNVAIGFMRDDIEIAKKAVAYLEKWHEQ